MPLPTKNNTQTKNPETRPSFCVVFVFPPQVRSNDKQLQQRVQSIPNDIKFNQGRMQCKSIRSNAFSYFLGSTGLVVEHAMWKKVLARYIGLRFHAATKVLVVAQKQNAEFNLVVNSQGSIEKSFKVALSS